MPFFGADAHSKSQVKNPYEIQIMQYACKVSSLQVKEIWRYRDIFLTQMIHYVQLYLRVLVHHLLGSTVVLEWKQFLLRLLGCTRKTHKSEMCLDVVQLNFRCLNIKDARAKRASIKNQIFLQNQKIKSNQKMSLNFHGKNALKIPFC